MNHPEYLEHLIKKLENKVEYLTKYVEGQARMIDKLAYRVDNYIENQNRIDRGD